MSAKRTPLRAVAADEAPPAPAKILSLSEAIAGGDYLEILLAQRREIASSLPEEKGPAKAALHRQLSLISKEIEALRANAEQEGHDGEGPAADEDFDADEYTTG